VGLLGVVRAGGHPSWEGEGSGGVGIGMVWDEEEEKVAGWGGGMRGKAEGGVVLARLGRDFDWVG